LGITIRLRDLEAGLVTPPPYLRVFLASCEPYTSVKNIVSYIPTLHNWLATFWLVL